MLSSGFPTLPGRATMLDTLFQRPHHVRRLRANPLGAILDQFTDYLLRRGQRADFVHQLVRAASTTATGLGTRHAAVTADHVTRASARQFLHEHLAICSCSARFPRSLIPSRAAVNHMLRMLDQQDPSRSAATTDSAWSAPGRVRPFLRQTCGLSGAHARLPPAKRSPVPRATLSARRPPAPDRLRAGGSPGLFPTPRRSLSPDRSPSWRPRCAASSASWRCLTASTPSLAGVVPAAPQWPLDRLPRSLTEETFERSSTTSIPQPRPAAATWR